jgi:tellurium resistance protein TerD
MSIIIKKGSSLNLTKKEPALKKIMVGLGWEFKSGHQIDLDVSVFMLGSNGKLPADEFLVFYNNLKSSDGSLQHTGDNRTGNDEGDDEIILANLPLIHPTVQELLFIVSIYEAELRRHNFGLLQDAYIRIVDVESKREILRYDLDAEFAKNTDVEFGKLQKINQEWHFVASGLGANIGLQGYVDRYI